MSFFVAFLAFSALIVLHEAGHFFAAKAVGMRVEKFYLFFPPKLVGMKKGETEYGVGMIPLGGFVKITGMNPDEELPPEVAARGYYKQPVWKRIFVIGAGPAVNIILAFLILWFLAFGIQQPSQNIAEVAPETPAAAKLLAGDRIISVDGVSGDQEAIANQIASHRCAGEQTDGCKATEPAEVVVMRDGERRAFEITPVYDAAAERSRLGFAFGYEDANPGPFEAARISADYMWFVTSSTVSALSQLYKSEQREQLSGVVGSYEVTRQAVDVGAREALTLIALISLSLGIINLFPFLPLDGGHIFWSVVEKIRGRPVPFAVMERAGLIGFALVIGLFILGLNNDIGRLTGEGFNVR
ncbi:MAG: regulator of sigma protease [Actinomycetota bacterium]|jgi:regulator of sigma E protease|nr:regulator of sigma protease [Actinomycetota bacterium]